MWKNRDRLSEINKEIKEKQILTFKYREKRK